jgi:putative ABC transport system ATP-binding protein
MEIVKINDLTFKWEGQKNNLLEIADFSIKKGERFFLKGVSGSGKSSLLGLLAGINEPQQGQIEVLGKATNKMKPALRDEFRANHIGYIFQQFNLVPYLSVIENVTLPCFFSDRRKANISSAGKQLTDEAKRLLAEVGLTGKEILNKPVSELSVGQQQRVAACRALIGSPELLIADEPTSSLDENAQKAFIDLLSEECKQNEITLLFVSHDTRFTHLFDRSATLHDGKIVMENPKSKGGAA